MPFIETKTTAHIDPDREKQLREALGAAIKILPGKSEQWLMLRFEGDCHMAFRGESAPDMAMLEIKIYGKATAGDYNALTARLTDICREVLGIPADRVYVRYDETAYWGWNGENF